NAGAQRLLGYRREEVLGKPASLIRPAGEEQTDPETADADEFRVTKSGSRISVHAWSQAVKLAEGEGFLEIIVPALEGAAIDTRQIVSRLRKQLIEERKTSEALRQSLAQLRAVGEETLSELKVMAEALRKEIERRKSVEQELGELKDRLAALSSGRTGTAMSAPREAEQAEELAGDPRARRWARFEDPRALTEILKDLGRRRQNGTLVVESDGMLAELSLDSGSVLSTAANSPDAFLTQRLVASGALSDEQRQRVLEIKQHTQLSLGRILLILGAVSEEQLIEAMSKKIADDVARVRAWPSGRWCFEEGTSDSRQAVPLRLDIGSLLGIDVHGEGEAPQEKRRAPFVVPDVDSGEWVIDVTSPALAAEEVVAPEIAAGTAVPAAAPGPAPMRIVASSNARKFHRETCKSVRRIEESTRLFFDSEAEAVRRGLKPCRLCITSGVEEAIGGEAMNELSLQAAAKSVVH
ncbi:MAG TPA: DUF4388 domain-containing protein, partial [Thermoanaerobaculia bacterium]|nr:DUF4388 domain-containing protein [Thermoanaerobaculia bacterium]